MQEMHSLSCILIQRRGIILICLPQQIEKSVWLLLINCPQILTLNVIDCDQEHGHLISATQRIWISLSVLSLSPPCLIKAHLILNKVKSYESKNKIVRLITFLGK